jgi:hypothetical protein
MSAKSWILASLVLLGAVYLKCALPVFAQEGVPVLHSMLAQEQVEIQVPEAWITWLTWG